MSVVAFNDLAQAYGAIDVFVGVTGAVPQGARIGLVGPNGVGKTSLLRLLAGLDTPHGGTITFARGVRLGYLPQESTGVSERTVWDEMLTAVADLREMEQRLHDLHDAMSDPAQYEAAVAEYTPLQELFEHRGGYTYELRIRQTLTGLGFRESDFHTPIPRLSGGQKTRALLARLLVEAPDLLVLDEPTNHLDVMAVEWLENFLRTWNGAALIVSHDRYFLDRTVNVIWEMRGDGLEVYRGNYSAYIQQREARWAQRLQVYEVEMGRLLNELDYIKRNINGQNVSQARGKLRRLSREIEAIEKLGIQAVVSKSWREVTDQASIAGRLLGVEELEDRIRALRPPQFQLPAFRLALKPRSRSGDIVLRTSDLTIGYPGVPLFTSGPIELHRQECAALIGPNGAGKTTFLRTVLGELAPLAGEVQLGASLSLGYFAQAHESLDPNATLIEEIEKSRPSMSLGEIRSYLAQYLFQGEEVFKQVSALSGGERGRLALAKLTLTRANLLLLDEPTNHLDIPAQEVLEAVLNEFDGTILLVTHDRYLVDKLATQIWWLDKAAQQLTVFNGSYQEFLAARDQGRLAAERAPSRVTNGRASDRRGDRAAEREAARAERQRAAKVAELEARIAALESEIAAVTQEIEAAGEAQDVQRLRRLGEQYERLEAELAARLDEWAEVAE